VSLIKLCKSIQHDLVPPVQSFERINPMINPSLPFKIAAAPTRLWEDAILSVSSAGLGGVNAHCIIRYPPPRFRRPLDGLLPSRRTNVKRLDAPARVERGVVVAGGFVDKARAIALCASRLLSVHVDVDTDLRNAGLDSNTQVRLVRMVLDLFGPPSLR
jgi:acyl transferase domain-containing protein